MKTIRLPLLTIASLLLAVNVGLSQDPLPKPKTTIPVGIVKQNQAIFDWSVPDRFPLHFTSYDVRTKEYLKSYINPESWPVKLDASKSYIIPIGSKMIYRWSISKMDSSYSFQTITTKDPKTTIYVPTLGSYVVKLELLNLTTNNLMAESSQNITVVDYLVISIGDSYASGEGNPDVNGIADDQNLSKDFIVESVSYDCDAPSLVKLWSDGKVPMSNDAIWLEPLAHRSELSGPALAAKEFEAADKKTSITFLTFATSGAKIDKGLIAAQHPEWQKNGGQIGDILNALQGVHRDVDLLLISIGGNDIGFSSWVEKATIYDLKQKDWLRSFKDLDHNILAESQITNSLDELSNKYDNLYVALRSTGINFKSTILTGYPTNLFFGKDVKGKDVLGDCGWFSQKEIAGIGVDGISPYEAQLFTNAGTELNRIIALKVLNFMGLDGVPKWDMTGVANDFEGHGYCSGSDCYYVYASNSCRFQGDLNGVLHPNSQGSSVYRKHILEIMNKHLNTKSTNN